MAPSATRYDFSPITKSETTPEGFLRVWCRAARTGTQLYRRADGSQVREYRPPEEVGKPESLSTFGMTPATWTHPPVLLDSKNTKQFQIGYSGSKVNYSDGFVEVALTITDQDAIDKIKRGDAREVSAGYKVEFDPTPGVTPDGQEYDGIQKDIRVNHIAIVPRGRAGPEVKLLMDRMDAVDAIADYSFDPEPTPSAIPPTSMRTMATIHLDGLDLELPAEAASAVNAHLRDNAKAVEALQADKAELQAKLDSASQELEDLAAEKEAAEGRADALTERVSELEEESSERNDIADLDDAIRARLELFQHLAPAFDDEFKFDGLSEAELYGAAYESLTGSAPREDASPDYLVGVVDGLLIKLDADEEEEEATEPGETAASPEPVEAKEDRADSTVTLRNALNGAGQTAPSFTSVYKQQLTENWKAPLHASK